MNLQECSETLHKFAKSAEVTAVTINGKPVDVSDLSKSVSVNDTSTGGTLFIALNIPWDRLG